jgi:hypothetical protein
MFVGFNFKNGQYGEGLKFLKFHREANQDQKTPCDIPYKKIQKAPKIPPKGPLFEILFERLKKGQSAPGYPVLTPLQKKTTHIQYNFKSANKN